MKSTTVIVSIIAAVAVIAAAFILGNAYKYKFKVNNTINVTGNAKKDFESDIVKWSASYSRKSMNLSEASEQLRQDRDLVKNFLVQKGIKENEILFDAVNIIRDFSYHTDERGNSFNTFTGYSLNQTVSVERSEEHTSELKSRDNLVC